MPIAAPPAASAWVDPSTGLDRPTHVTRAAQIPERNWQPGHRGVDLGMHLGGAVRAAGDGVVAYVGTIAGTPVISIVHPNGLRTTYQPVLPAVETGDLVVEGAVIGVLAPSFSAHSGKHDGLHWGALTGPDAYIDPLTLLEPAKIRLKPLDGSSPARRHRSGIAQPPVRQDAPNQHPREGAAGGLTREGTAGGLTREGALGRRPP